NRNRRPLRNGGMGVLLPPPLPHAPLQSIFGGSFFFFSFSFSHRILRRRPFNRRGQLVAGERCTDKNMSNGGHGSGGRRRSAWRPFASHVSRLTGCLCPHGEKGLIERSGAEGGAPDKVAPTPGIPRLWESQANIFCH
ncbi:hypothetical protein TSMEX_005728, partial [Taenia solium]